MKYDNKNKSIDLKEARERFEKVKVEYQAQFNGLKKTILTMKAQLNKDSDIKTLFEDSIEKTKRELKQYKI